MTEPLRNKNQNLYYGAFKFADIKSAVEYRKTWKPYFVNDDCSECGEHFEVLHCQVNPDTTGFRTYYMLCANCVEEHCYPDLFVEKGEEFEGVCVCNRTYNTGYSDERNDEMFCSKDCADSYHRGDI